MQGPIFTGTTVGQLRSFFIEHANAEEAAEYQLEKKPARRS